MSVIDLTIAAANLPNWYGYVTPWLEILTAGGLVYAFFAGKSQFKKTQDLTKQHLDEQHKHQVHMKILERISHYGAEILALIDEMEGKYAELMTLELGRPESGNPMHKNTMDERKEIANIRGKVLRLTRIMSFYTHTRLQEKLQHFIYMASTVVDPHLPTEQFIKFALDHREDFGDIFFEINEIMPDAYRPEAIKDGYHALVEEAHFESIEQGLKSVARIGESLERLSKEASETNPYYNEIKTRTGHDGNSRDDQG
ncbi:MAG: hypothetical protein ACX94C_05805 [Phycisphaerales bacterium]